MANLQMQIQVLVMPRPSVPCHAIFRTCHAFQHPFRAAPGPAWPYAFPTLWGCPAGDVVALWKLSLLVGSDGLHLVAPRLLERLDSKPWWVTFEAAADVDLGLRANCMHMSSFRMLMRRKVGHSHAEAPCHWLVTTLVSCEFRVSLSVVI